MVNAVVVYTSVQVWYPLLRFREEGMTTFSVGPEEGKIYTSKKGYPCKADKTIDNVSSQVRTRRYAINIAITPL